MIGSPCKDCPKKNLPKDKCISRCKLIKRIQEMDKTLFNWNGGCSIDYTEVYSINIPTSLASKNY